MMELFEPFGMEIVKLHKFYTLPFPYDFYRRKLFGSEVVLKMLLPQ